MPGPAVGSRQRNRQPFSPVEVAFLTTIDPDHGTLRTDHEFVSRFPDRDVQSARNFRARNHLPASSAILKRRRERVYNTSVTDDMPPAQPSRSFSLESLPEWMESDVEPTEDQLDELLSIMSDMDSALGAFSPMKDSVTFSPPDDLPTLICLTGDWHIGASGVEIDRLRDDLTAIGEVDGVYAIGMGDWIEGVGVANKAAPALYSGIVNKSEVQVALAVRVARLIGDKWIAMMAGNHELMAYRATGIERANEIARKLNVPYFGQGGGTVFIELGDQRYVVGVRHNGKGNSQLNTSNAQRRTFDEWPEWENADVIGLAHLHFNDLHIAPRKGGHCVYLRSGTAKTRDGYARDNGFTPEYGIPSFVVYPDRKEITPFHGTQIDSALRFVASERANYAAVAS